MTSPSSPLRVTHIASTLQGGAGIGLQRYHAALLEVGVHSRIVIRDSPLSQDPRVSRAARLPISFFRRLIRKLRLETEPSARLRRRVTRLDQATYPAPNYELFSSPYSEFTPETHAWVKDADIVNLHFTAEFVDWVRFARSITKPLMVTLHDQNPYLGGFHYSRDRDSNPHLSALDDEMRTIKKYALERHKVAVIANSRWNAESARSSGFFDEKTQIETAYYPLDTTLYCPRDSHAARETLGLPEKGLIIGFGSEDLSNSRKGFDALLESLASLPADLRETIMLLSFGRPPPTALVASLPVPWTHLGSLQTDTIKVAAYAAMDVFVVPSRAEAFGLTALEASAVGIPVVANPVGGLLEAVPSVEEFSASQTPNTTMSECLLSQLAPLLRDKNLRHQRSIAGRLLAKKRHDPVTIGHQLKAFHLKLIAS
jgi:glycosyltransferase involved in cell wall biosynthesis